MPRFAVAWAISVTVLALVVTLIFIDTLRLPWSPYMDSTISRYALPAIVVTFAWTVAGWMWIEVCRGSTGE